MAYLASYADIGADPGVRHQALLRFPRICADPAWQSGLHALLEDAVDSFDGEFAVRLAIEDGALVRYLFLSHPDADTVAAIAGRLERLNDIRDGSVASATDSVEHDEWAQRVPPHQLRVGGESYPLLDLRVPCAFSIVLAARRLLRAGLCAGEATSVQFSCARRAWTRDERRAALKTVASLRAEAGVPPRLPGYLEPYCEQMIGTSTIADQFVASGSSIGLRSLQALVGHEFRSQLSPLGFGEPPLSTAEGERDLVHTGLNAGLLRAQDWADALSSIIDVGALVQLFLEPADPDWVALGLRNWEVTSPQPQDLLAQIELRLRGLEQRMPDAEPATTRSLANAVRICEIDLPAAAATARGVVEGIVERLRSTLPGSAAVKRPDLAGGIDVLRKHGVIPATIESSMHTVRVFGNVGAHRTLALSRSDIEVCLLQALRVVEWYLAERS